MSLTWTSQILLKRLPKPLSLGLNQLLIETTPAQQVRQFKALLEIFLRYTSGILLSAYLRGEAVEKIESRLSVFEKPSYGHYCELIREILRAFREQENHFFEPLVQWYYDEKGKPSEEARRLDAILNLRNKDAHGIMETDKELMPKIAPLIQEVQLLLLRARWLSGYRVFRISDQTRQRGRTPTYVGNIHFFSGSTMLPTSKKGTWSCELYKDTVYLSHPKGQSFLELSPLFSYEYSQRMYLLYSWVSTPKRKCVEQRCDYQLKTKEHMPLLHGDPVPWDVYLKCRAELERIHSNTLTEDFTSTEFEEIGHLFNNRYLNEKLLGEGGMATVYLVNDTFKEEQVALKLIHIESLDSTDKQRMEREFKLMTKIDHPHILKTKDFVNLEYGRIAIVMPLMKKALNQNIEKKVYSETQIQKYAAQILKALDFLHSKEPQILHRDVKPSNILLDDNDNAFLADFGVALRGGDKRLTNIGDRKNVGTKQYMAPELAQGVAAGPETDRFSLGMTLHQLMTGRLPDKRKVGQGIEGPFGDFIRMLGHTDRSVRLKARWGEEVQAEPAQCEAQEARRDIMPGESTKRLIMNISDAQKDEEFDVWVSSKAIFGRDGAKSDFVLLIEPIAPKDIYAQNIHKSMSISSRHLSISIQGRRAVIQDLSTNGTKLNGITLAKDRHYSLDSNSKIEFADVLECGVSIIDDHAEGIGAIVVTKKNNTPNKKYVMLNSKMPIVLSTIKNKSVPIELRVENDELQMHFHEAGLMHFNEAGSLKDFKILANQYVPLKDKLSIIKIAGLTIKLL